MSKKKINEIFYSLQGEGVHTGIPSVFVRFSGCNLKCNFCDTKHEDGVLMSDMDIAKEINKFPAEWIILTGGEPSLWIDDVFIDFLKKETGKKIAIETNGSVKLPENIDWITFSPKIGIGGVGDYEILIEKADEIKVIDTGQNLNDYFNLGCVTPSTSFRLQPCFVSNEFQFQSNIKRTIDNVLKDPRWTLSLQAHRILGIK